MRIINADIFDQATPDKWCILAHSVNCKNTMGSGIAKEIKERYPSAYYADKEAWTFHRSELGMYSVGHYKQLTIANLYTQENYGIHIRQVNYEAFYKALSSLRYHNPDKDIYLPYGISCGLAGGSWKIISAMIEDVEEKSGTSKEFIVCKL